jgi:large subunit ribosomal protein L2
MAIKKYKPTSASRRSMTGILYRKVDATEPYKPLTTGFKRHVGRNHHGRITAPHKGGGHKRFISRNRFQNDENQYSSKNRNVEYDPNRSAFIGLVCYRDGERRYMVLPHGCTGWCNCHYICLMRTITPGNRLPLSNIPVGTFVYNIEIKPGNGAKMVRSAGSFAQVTAHNDGRTQLKMPSGEIRTVSDKCFASIGSVSNPDYQLVNLGKAGRSRWKGIRPTTRGSAMNPVDHPHGGGEGRQGIGLRRGPKTRYGKQAYGVRTRTPKKYSNYASCYTSKDKTKSRRT